MAVERQAISLLDTVHQVVERGSAGDDGVTQLGPEADRRRASSALDS